MIYALHDSDPNKKRMGAFEIKKDEIAKYQNELWGVHWTPNIFNGARKAENIKEIRYWFTDSDDGEKAEMLEKINNLPLIPSFVVETKRGYHCYWKAIDASIDNFRNIQSGLIKRLNADPACKDVCRMLRMPNTLHLKDPNEPFLLKTVQKNNKEYTEKMMLLAYELPKPVYKKLDYKGDKEDLLDPKNWDKIFRISSFMAEGRNNSLARVTLWLRDEGFERGVIRQTITNMNNALRQPLDTWELNSILRGKI